VDIGEASTVGVVNVGVIRAIWVWVELTCKVSATTEPVRFWLIVWVDKLGWIGKLQAERITTSERDIDSSLNVFIFAFEIATKIYSGQFDLQEPAELRQLEFVTIIIYETLPSRIHRPGGVRLGHLGETLSEAHCKLLGVSQSCENPPD
jgi:hypothetical protein